MCPSKNDHFVSQTYLSSFVNSGGKLTPYYKFGRTVIGKPRYPKAVCSLRDGDANSYFDNPRLLDIYLAPIENSWQTNIAALAAGALNHPQKIEISLYIAYLLECNPVTIRRRQTELAAWLKSVAASLAWEDLYGPHAAFPEDASSRALMQGIRDEGGLSVSVDPEFAHSRGMRALVGTANRLSCSHWLKLTNATDVPFLTSDNPAVFFRFRSTDPGPSLYVALTPRDAVVISPNEDLPAPTDEDAQNHSDRQDQYGRLVKRAVALRFNELLVQSADRLVLHATREKWVEALVTSYRSIARSGWNGTDLTPTH